jgi:hypothetical protein
MSMDHNGNRQSINAPRLNTGLIALVSSQVGLAIIGIIVLALIAGLAIDEVLETENHPFTIILFLGSVPLSLIVTYWLARRATRGLTAQKSVTKPSLPVEEENNRE